jgi:NADH-quinone oxidoreductase subunit E/NADP-reducing hydrogenase subunit HndA
MDEMNHPENFQVQRVITLCSTYSNDSEHLVEILHKIQEEFGHISVEIQKIIADQLDVPLAKVSGIISFYSDLTSVARGKFPITVCLGVACKRKGAEKVLHAFQKELEIETGITVDKNFSLETVNCAGACGLAPVVTIDGHIFKHIEPDMVKNILKDYK